MNAQTYPECDNPIERLIDHCGGTSPVGRPSSSCERCKLRHLKCVVRRNVEGSIVGCSHCLTSNDFSVMCSLAIPSTFYAYRPMFHQRLLTTDDLDSRKLCLRHEDPDTNNLMHPPALQSSSNLIDPIMLLPVDARLPNGSPGPGTKHDSVDARLPNGSPGPDKCVHNIHADRQCRSCVNEHMSAPVSPLKFHYQRKNIHTNGLIRGARRFFYLPSNEVNTFHCREIRGTRVKFIPKCSQQVWIECTNFPFKSLSDGARGCLVMFTCNGMVGYKLGVISGMMYHVEQLDGPNLNGVIRLYEWVGKPIPLISGECIDLYHCYNSFDELTTGRLDGHQFKIRLVEREFHLGKDDDHFKMVFVNRCMGNDYESKYDDVVNPIDGCVQHSSLGKSLFT